MPKNTDKPKAPRQKDALEQSVSLIRASWDVFESLWDTRNEILHSGENMLMEAEMNATEIRLIQFRRNCHTLLRECDWAFIDKPEVQILNWSREKKRHRLYNLERLHRVYLTELKKESERQRPITYFFQPVVRVRARRSASARRLMKTWVRLENNAGGPLLAVQLS
jgi:hypothetical protein